MESSGFRLRVGLPCGLPYRIDIPRSDPDALDVLVDLGALDIESIGGGLAVIIPDSVTPEDVASALGTPSVSVSDVVARDSGSVWLLSPRAVRIGGVLITTPEAAAPALSDPHRSGGDGSRRRQRRVHAA